MPLYGPLTHDAHHFLIGDGCKDPNAEYIPDGPRHYAAVQEVLAFGYSEYRQRVPNGMYALAVTEAGQKYFELGVDTN